VVKEEVIAKHYLANYDVLVKRITRRVPNQSIALAEEVVQEAYTRALKYFRAYRKNENFEKWFSTILRNATNDCRAAEGGNNKEYDNEEVVTPHFSYYEANEFLRDMNKYSKRDSEVLMMFHIHGFTSKDVAIYTGLSHTNVRQIIYKFSNRNETPNRGN